jgi:hypothetical protein
MDRQAIRSFGGACLVKLVLNVPLPADDGIVGHRKAGVGRVRIRRSPATIHHNQPSTRNARSICAAFRVDWTPSLTMLRKTS